MNTESSRVRAAPLFREDERVNRPCNLTEGHPGIRMQEPEPGCEAAHWSLSQIIKNLSFLSNLVWLFHCVSNILILP
jgi:hypothetical protein